MRYDPISRLYRVYEGGGKSAPAPDYRGAAVEQGQSSKEVTAMQTWANRPTLNTPWGTQTWDTSSQIDPATGVPVTAWTQNFNLTPEAQASLTSQDNVTMGRSKAAEQLLGQATSAFGTPFNWDDAPGAGSMGDYDPNTIRQKSEDALFQRQMNRIEPGLTQSENARRTRLANMGITPEGGSEAWSRAQASMDTTRSDAIENASLNAISGGGAEAQREFQLRSGGAQEQDRQRQAYIAGEAQRRGMSLNELNALLTGQQVTMPQMPGTPAPTAGAAQATPFLQAAQLQGQQPQGSGTDWGSAIGGAASVAAVAF